MPFNGSGSHSLPEAPIENGQTADADVVQSNFDDISDGLTGSLRANGEKPAAANQPMGGFRHTDVGAATLRTMYARTDQVADSSLTYGGVAGGTANALTFAPSPAIAAYALGQRFHGITGAAANTSTVKIDVNSVGDGPLKWPDGSAMAAAALPPNSAIEFTVVDISTPTEPVFHLQTVTRNPAAMQHSLIRGLTYANNVGDTTNDIDIAAGSCMDSTSVYPITLAALTKRLDAAWAVGTNQGGLDTGSIGNSDYYIWAIARSDTGVTDALFSLSATAPTMPASYDYKRLIGWFKRAGGSILGFKTYETEGGGIDFRYTTQRLDVDLTDTLTTARRTDALSVPLDFSVVALITALASDNSATFAARVCCPDEADGAPSFTAVPLANLGNVDATDIDTKEMSVRTSATGTIAARASIATVDFFRVATSGFQWPRR